MYSGSFGVAGFIAVRPGDVRFVRCRCVHWGAPWGLLFALGVARFIGLGPGGHRVRSGSLGSLWSTLRGRLLRSG